jgi:hypothetical protein
VRRGKCTRFWWETSKQRDHLKDQGVDGRMGITMNLSVIGWVGGRVEWIHVAQCTNRWRALVNTVMNLWFLAPLRLLVSYPHVFLKVGGYENFRAN